MNRRAFLTTVAASCSLSAGCLGSGHRAVDEGQWTFEGDGTGSLIQGTVTIPEGQYAPYQLRPASPLTLRYVARADAAIDTLLLDKSEYDARYRDGDSIQYHSALSATDTTTADCSGPLQPGDYVLCFDNSEVYGAAPTETVTVDFVIRSQR
jgi:hypothetical protein